MFIIMGFVVVGGMFYYSAKKVNKSTGQWVSIGLGIYFILGLIFLIVTEKYILKADTLAEAWSLMPYKLLLSAISALILITISYLIKEKFLGRKKNRAD